MSARRWAREWVPPGAVKLARMALARLRPAPWERVPRWEPSQGGEKGWSDESIVSTQSAKWAEFVRRVGGTGPLGVAHEAQRPGDHDYAAHNTIMAFAYVLARAARTRARLSVLDWGGGLGHYYVLSRALMPDLELEYHCKDLPAMCAKGRELLPGVRFHESARSVAGRSYDLVLASSSLHYSEDWRDTVHRLAQMTGSYLYVTRTPVVWRAESFVVVQRPRDVGYRTEYPGWFLNRQELLQGVEAHGMELVREFLIDERPFVPNAPEQGEYRGFLWRPAGRAGAAQA